MNIPLLMKSIDVNGQWGSVPCFRKKETWFLRSLLSCAGKLKPNGYATNEHECKIRRAGEDKQDWARSVDWNAWEWVQTSKQGTDDFEQHNSC